MGLFPGLTYLWVDHGYKAAFVASVEQESTWTVDIVQQPIPPRGGTGQAIRELL
jgi:hypothetical protein